MDNSAKLPKVLILVTTVLGLTLLYLHSKGHPDRLHQNPSLQTTWRNASVNVSSSYKTILLWTRHYGHSEWGFGLGRDPFLRAGCPVSGCRTTTDRSELRDADAVVFSLFNRNMRNRNYKLPPRMRPEQVYVMVVFESPMRMFYDIGKYDDRFNLTWSYLNDTETDIVVPAGSVVPLTVPTKLPCEKILRQKTKKVAWIVSNCKAPSQRMNYVRELRKYVQVGIFGKCGNYSCPRKSPKCYEEIGRNYKFFLAFENSFCTDYVTEKLFRTLQYNIVPITLSRIANNSSFLPHDSFIDVRDFQSPKFLAEYLHWLDKNDAEYLKYLKWKETSEVRQKSMAAGFCRLCQILHTPSYPYKSDFNPKSYWDSGRWCLRNEAEKRATHL